MNKFIKIGILVILSLIILLYDDLYRLATLYFYVLLVFLIFDIINYKKVKLIHVWCIGFIYIILSEVFLNFEIGLNVYALNALKYLIIANNLILMGYYSKGKYKINEIKRKHYTYETRKAGWFLLIALVILYVAMAIQRAITSISMSRAIAAEGENFLIISVLNAMGFLLPSVILFYFYHIKKTSLVKPLLLSAPIFLILFLEGSRFPLLFAFLGFFITYQNLNSEKISVKKILLMGSAILILLSASYVMKEFRVGNQYAADYIETKTLYEDFPTYVSQYLSNEGIIDMTSLMMQHYTTHNHTYGATSSFILYFWVPRVFWETKPTMLGHWFIRQYRSGFSEGHSASFGFTGELFADFGYFSLFFVFIIGRFIKYAEKFQAKALASNSYNVILGAMLFPYVFFFVRSPITGSTTFLGILFFFFIFKRIIFKEVKVINFK